MAEASILDAKEGEPQQEQRALDSKEFMLMAATEFQLRSEIYRTIKKALFPKRALIPSAPDSRVVTTSTRSMSVPKTPNLSTGRALRS
jgi:predicted DNA-binding transcriptional regulator AlpA